MGQRPYICAEEKLIAMVPKAASTSMRKTIQPDQPYRGRVTREVAVEMGLDIVMWIREPLERLACAHNMLKYGAPRHLDVALTPSEFVERCVLGYSPELHKPEVNIHWIPQVEMHSLRGKFLPTRVYLFDNLQETWKLEFPDIELKHENVSGNRLTADEFMTELSAETRDAIVRYYVEDSALYQSLTQ